MSMEKLSLFIEGASDSNTVEAKIRKLRASKYLVDWNNTSLSLVKVDAQNQKRTPGDILSIRNEMEKDAQDVFPQHFTHLLVRAGGNGLVYSLGVGPNFDVASKIARLEKVD